MDEGEIRARIEETKWNVWVLRDMNGDQHYKNPSDFLFGVTPEVGKTVVMAKVNGHLKVVRDSVGA